VFLKIFYNLRKLLIISNLTLRAFNFMAFYTELTKVSFGMKAGNYRLPYMCAVNGESRKLLLINQNKFDRNHPKSKSLLQSIVCNYVFFIVSLQQPRDSTISLGATETIFLKSNGVFRYR